MDVEKFLSLSQYLNDPVVPSIVVYIILLLWAILNTTRMCVCVCVCVCLKLLKRLPWHMSMVLSFAKNQNLKLKDKPKTQDIKEYKQMNPNLC